MKLFCRTCERPVFTLSGTGVLLHEDGSQACAVDGKINIRAEREDGDPETCDFCRATPVVADVHCPDVVIEVVDDYGNKGQRLCPEWWAACGPCRNLIKADRWDDVELQVTTKILSMIPGWDANVRAHALALASAIVSEAQSAYTGEVKERDGEEPATTATAE